MTTLSSLAGRALGAAQSPLGAALGGAITTTTGGTVRAGAVHQSSGLQILPARTAGKAGGARSTRAGRARTGTTAARKTGTAKPGYARTALPAEFAFLRDPRLSIEEKLSRFCGLIMAKAEKDLLAQMEKMAPGSKAGAAGGTTGGAPKKKSGGIWGAVKLVLPQVGMAATVLGDATAKKLVQQLTGPVMAAAATALGMPQLAPLALKAGAELARVATDEGKGTAATVGSALAGLVGEVATGGTAGASGGAKAGAGAAGGSGGTTPDKATAKAAGDEPRSEKADQLELQRLMEREKETFTLLSNILRMNHEARMTSVQNIR